MFLWQPSSMLVCMGSFQTGKEAVHLVLARSFNHWVYACVWRTLTTTSWSQPGEHTPSWREKPVKMLFNVTSKHATYIMRFHLPQKPLRRVLSSFALCTGGN